MQSMVANERLHPKRDIPPPPPFVIKSICKAESLNLIQQFWSAIASVIHSRKHMIKVDQECRRALS